jgi:hypothetical protein
MALRTADISASVAVRHAFATASSEAQPASVSATPLSAWGWAIRSAAACGWRTDRPLPIGQRGRSRHSHQENNSHATTASSDTPAARRT